jgi:hypothetical protein
MLVPPQNPMVKKKGQASWKIINDGVFNGREEDHFGKTSMHLSFTEYHVPHFDGTRGGHDSQIHFLESVVSVHDSGVWVGDVDVLKALNDVRVSRMQPLSCKCQNAGRLTKALVSIESWDEVLDPPNESIIVRATGNWISRLAVTAILVQTMPSEGLLSLEKYFTICPPAVCWACNDPNPEKKNPYALHGTRSLLAPNKIFVY